MMWACIVSLTRVSLLPFAIVIELFPNVEPVICTVFGSLLELLPAIPLHAPKIIVASPTSTILTINFLI